MATAVDIGTLITRTPGRHGGRPCIGRTGPSILAIVELFEMGVSPAEIKDEHFPHVPMEGIFAALAYWAANREEVDGYFREDQEAHDELFGPTD
jgi:uncharacterized protein (DUF433 family)